MNKNNSLGLSLHQRIEAQMQLSPDAQAVSFAGQSLNYQQLNQRANQCGHYLRSVGVGPGKIVGILMDRSLEMVVALLAVLKSGAAYLPLDVDDPQARRDFILTDANIGVLLTQQKYADSLDNFDGTSLCLDSEWSFVQDLPDTNLDVAHDADDLAYVIYTSGSTGQPKGCLVSHQAICNRLSWMADHYQISPADRILQKTPITFDVSVWEFFLPLLTGATLVLARPNGHKDNHYLLALVAEQRVTIGHFVPSMLNLFLNQLDGQKAASLQKVFVSGEALGYELMLRFFQQLPTAQLHNLYGPTEAAVDVTYWHCQPRDDGKVPIGQPINNIQIHILDDDLNPVAKGEAGELCIGGVGVAKGYLNRPELSAEKFVADPFATDSTVSGKNTATAAKMYRTGDRARLLADGNIEYLGRVDFQVKLRGFRIELGEIESALEQHPSVQQAVVVIQDAAKGDAKLVAYVSAIDCQTLDNHALKDFAKQRLAVHMVPNLIVAMAQLPLTAHGKVDRKALPWPIKSMETAPMTMTEITQSNTLNKAEIVTRLLGFFSELLSNETLQASDDLFDFGATSFTMIQAVEKIQSHFGVNVPVDVFLQDPSINGVADYVLLQMPQMPQTDEPVQSKALSEIELAPVDFRDQAYVGVSTQSSTGAITLASLGQLLSLLKQHQVGQSAKYLYASAGGLNPIQTYVYVKPNRIAGLAEGVYYYQPIEHQLYLISGHIGSHIGDSNGFAHSDFALFFIAQLAAIVPTYQGLSPVLSILEAGYMAQLLTSRQGEFKVQLQGAGNVDFAEIAPAFALTQDHQFIHCLFGAASPFNEPSFAASGQTQSSQTGHDIFTACQACEQRLHQQPIATKQSPIRAFAGHSTPIALEARSFADSYYLLRGAKRDYAEQPVSLDKFSQLLALLQPKTIQGQSRHLYGSTPALSGLKTYVYLREGGVAGIPEGVYLYADQKLQFVSSTLSQDFKTCHMPFNRQHAAKAKFCIFLVAPLASAENQAQQDHYQALLQAGYIGQLLLDRQGEFDIGLCPIGGLMFDKIRDSFKLAPQQQLIHSFVGGAFELERPSDWPYLQASSQSQQSYCPNSGDLAIVGMSGRFAGADNLEQYWHNLAAGSADFSHIYFDSASDYRSEKTAVEHSQSSKHWGGFIHQVDCFDSLLFKIAPAEAKSIDPQERLLLEVVWECLENSGNTATGLNQAVGSVGVFVGAMWDDYQHHASDGWQQGQNVPAVSHHSSIANRISHFFDFYGPSLALNTSCSSAMTAMHFACQGIKQGDCRAAIVAGVNILSHPYHYEMLRGLGLLSPNGEASPFGSQGSGWVVGEGAAAIVIKTKADALRDGDYIHGIIKGTAINHSGNSVRYSAPKSSRQAEAITQVLENAGVAADSISYIEAGAAGASMADASEMTALKSVFSSAVAVSSVKANIGHLESASAMSQLLKVLLQFKHQQIAPTLNCAVVNPMIQLDSSGLQIVKTLQPWQSQNSTPRRALINAFGATGAAGHMVVEEYSQPLSSSSSATNSEQLILLSAATTPQLKQLAQRMVDFLQSTAALPNLADIAYTLRVGRVVMAEKLTLTVSSIDDLRQQLQDFLQGNLQGNLQGKEQGTQAQLSAPTQGKRVPLPTYPFAKVSHWVNQTVKEEAPKPVAPKQVVNQQALQSRIEQHLKKRFAAISQVPIDQLKTTVPFADYGINSAMIASLNGQLESDFGELSKTLFFEYQSIAELAQYLLNEHRPALNGFFDLSNEAVVSTSEPKPLAPVRRPVVAGDRVAIVGLSGIYPNADNLGAFWRNLKNGVDCISEIPKDRWDIDKFYQPDGLSPGKIKTNWGGFISDVDKFDPQFFNISPKQAPFMDPQERLFLQTAWHTMEDAGYDRDACEQAFNRKVGVYVGVMYGEYQLYSPSNNLRAEGLAVGSSYGSIANRVSYFFDFNGPSMAIDTLCSSSLTAFHLAVNAVKNGECEAALAGGVSISIHPNKYIMASQLNMPSSDGRCRSFGAGGDGFIPGEGVGAVLLRPLAKAVAAGDHIYAVVRGSCVNHDGRTHGYTVPNPNAQAQMILEALENAAIDPANISYIEAHGTGTLLGDPVEITSLTKAFKHYTDKLQYCAIGSVKSNIGHLESAAGIAGLSKILLQMKHRQLVPSLHSQTLNPNINFAETPFYVQQTLAPWQQPRIACISGFGAGGANAHVIVEEYQHDEVALPDEQARRFGPVIIALSAINSERLQQYTSDLLAFVQDEIAENANQQQCLIDLAYTFQTGRQAMGQRLALIVDSMAQLQQGLAHFIAGQAQEGAELYLGDVKSHQSAMEIFAEDAVLQAAINQWVAHKHLAKIAELWVKGLKFDWGTLYQSELQYQPKRISAPLYPFAKQRYWLDIPAQAIETAPTQTLAAAPGITATATVSGPAPLSKPQGIVLQSLDDAPAASIMPAIHTLPVEPAVPAASQSSPVQLFDYGKGVFCIKVEQAKLCAGVLNGLSQSFAALKQQQEAKVVLLQGAEATFLAAQTGDEEAFFAAQIPMLMLQCELPVIAVMAGEAIGLGWFVGAMCDFMICSESGVYGGFDSDSPWAFAEPGQALFALRFGNDFAKALLTPNSRFSGAQLRSHGLTMPIVAADKLESHALELAYQLSERLKNALVLLKQHLCQGLTAALKNLLNALSPVHSLPYEQTSILTSNLKTNLWQPYLDQAPAASHLAVGTAKRIDLACEVLQLDAYDNGVVVVSLQDRDSKNLFSPAYVNGLTLAFEHVKNHPDYKVMILTGYDHYFACGGSKEGLLTIQKGQAKYSDSPLYEYPLQCDIPVIAAMQGHGIGAGWSMGMYCDLNLFSEESVFSTRFMQYGFTPGFGSTLIFPQRLSQDLGRELLFTASDVKGSQLKARGISQPVLPRAQVLDYALAVAGQMALSSRNELIELKKQANALIRSQLKDTVKQELAMHDQTFIGNTESLRIIENEFQQGLVVDDVVDDADDVVVDQAADADSGLPEPEFKLEGNPQQQLEAIVNRLQVTLADELFVDADDLDLDMQFIDLGLDSITGVTWMQKINRDFGLAVVPTKVYSHPTLNEFAEYVAQEIAQRPVSATIQTVEKAKETVSEPTLSEPTLNKPLKMQRIELSPQIVIPSQAAVAEPRFQAHTQNDTKRIAVIGMAGQFPQAENLDVFWQNLVDGKDCITAIPPSRWEVDQYYDPTPHTPGKTYSKWMGMLDDIDQFDGGFFNIPVAEAQTMDPQQKMFLQNCWHCIEDSTYKPSQLSGSRCGVFVGCGISDFGSGGSSANGSSDEASGLGGATSTLVGRISYLLNLQGPGMAIETACSSSLVAIASACDSLLLNNSDYALAGGVFVMTGPSMQMVTSQAGMLSKQGRCFAFDQKADGFVLSEGVGVVLLKRLADAERDGDLIHGVITGWGVNQDGKTNGLNAPNPDSQARLVKEVYQKFAIDAAKIQLVETHGTGTQLGDPIEIEGLKSAFKNASDKQQYCALGALKSNIGHSLMAAGVAGVLKVLLCIKHQKIPPTVHFEQLNRHIDLAESPFYINTQCQDWIVPEGEKRCAATSAFGLSGTNAHVVIEEYLAQPTKPGAILDETHSAVVVLSAKNPEALRRQASQLNKRGQSRINLVDLAYTLQVGREAMSHRLALVVNSLDQLQQKLQCFLSDDDSQEGIFVGQVLKGKGNKVGAVDDHDNLPQLADLWTKGAAVDWAKLYRGANKPKRISLPGYPFAKQSLSLIPATQPQAQSQAQSQVQTAALTLVPSVAATTTTPKLDLAEKIHCCVTELVAELLAKNPDELDDSLSFFELGLTSVGIVQLVEQLEGLLQSKLSSTLLFEHSTIADLADYLQREFANEFAGLQPQTKTATPLLLYGDKLSSIQQLFLNLNRDYPRTHVHTILLKLKAPLPQQWVEQLAERLLGASRLFRCVYDEQLGCQLRSDKQSLDIIQHYDFSAMNQRQKEKALIVLNMDEFDLQQSLPVRLNVIQWSTKEVVLALGIHHIVYDAFSLARLLQTLVTKNDASDSQAQDDSNDYAEFYAIEQNFLASKNGAEAAAYWQTELKDSQIQPNWDSRFCLKPRTRRKKPSSEYDQFMAHYHDFLVRDVSFQFDPELAKQLLQYCQAMNINESVLLQYVYLVSVMDLGQQDDLVMGTLLSYPRTRETENIIGPLLNVSFSRLQLNDRRDHHYQLSQFNQKQLRQFGYHLYPMKQVLEAKQADWQLDPKDFSIYMPVMFNYLNNSLNGTLKGQNPWFDLDGMSAQTFSPSYLKEICYSDVYLFVGMDEYGVHGRLRIKDTRFNADFEQQLLERMENLMKRLVEKQADAV